MAEKLAGRNVRFGIQQQRHAVARACGPGVAAAVRDPQASGARCHVGWGKDDPVSFHEHAALQPALVETQPAIVGGSCQGEAQRLARRWRRPLEAADDVGERGAVVSEDPVRGVPDVPARPRRQGHDRRAFHPGPDDRLPDALPRLVQFVRGREAVYFVERDRDLADAQHRGQPRGALETLETPVGGIAHQYEAIRDVGPPHHPLQDLGGVGRDVDRDAVVVPGRERTAILAGETARERRDPGIRRTGEQQVQERAPRFHDIRARPAGLRSNSDPGSGPGRRSE